MPYRNPASFSGRRRSRKRRMRLILILLLILAAAACLLFFFPPGAGEKPSDASSAPMVSSSEPPDSPEISSEPSSLPESEASHEPAASSEPAVSSEPESSEESERSYIEISAAVPPGSEESSGENGEASSDTVWAAYDYTAPVPESDPVDDSYFDKVVFVGDSRTQGFVLYSGLTNLTAYADRGLTVESAATKEIVPGENGKHTVLDALKLNEDCQAVYMMFGINELGWTYSNVFVEKYAALVDAVRENHPSVEIYLQSILPVSAEKSASDKYINNSRIQEYNDLIRQLAADKQVYYLDLYSVFADESGALPGDAASDGVHLKKAYCEKWLDYLRNHVGPDYSEREG